MWITTSAATSVASTTASLNGSATLNLTDPKFCYSTSAPGSNFDPTTCSPVTASGSYTAAVTGLTASTTYYFQIFGTVSGTIYYGAVLNFTTSAAASTYSITVNAGTGGTASSSAATVTSGGNVTLTATPSSGYSFSSWTCSGGGTLSSSTTNPATLSGIAANATCTANFTRNSGGGGGIGPNNPNTGGGSAQNVKIVVQKSSTPGGNNPNRPTTPGATAPVLSPQPVTTTVTTTVVNQDGSKVTTTTTGVTNSSASAAGQTNSSGGSINALTNLGDAPGQANNEAKVEAKDTTAETKMIIDANVPPSVVVNRGQDNKIQVQAVNGWTGRVSVAVVNESDDTDVKSYLEVVINPLPVTNVEIQLPERGKKPEIKFDPSPSQVIKYEIQLNGKTVCEGTETACALPKLIGPKSKVDIIARGQDDTAVVTRLPAFTPPAPIPALTVYFPLASSQLTRSEIKKLDKFVKEVKAAGFTRVVLEGHTDVQGARSGYNNLALSNSRAQATANYLRKFLKVRFAKDQFAETKPAVEGSGEAVYQNNRRTEVYVW
jgi:outer membrane protein OmpA-like peptidoglycan-associated protein